MNVDCGKCNDLIINDTNPKQTTFLCGINKRSISSPAWPQRWCPKITRRKASGLVKTSQQDTTIQTTYMEMALIQKWADNNKLKTLKGYSKGLALRDRARCSFSVDQVSVFVQGKIKELGNK